MVQRQVVWSKRAVTDKIAIYEFWTSRNGSAAYSIKLEKLFGEALAQVSDYPNAGRSTDKKGVRVLTVNHFNVFYSLNEKAVFVLTIFDTRRDDSKLKL